MVVIRAAIRQYQMPCAEHCNEIRDIVRSRIAVIQKAAFLNKKFPCVEGSAVPRLPANRALPAALPDDLDRGRDALLLLLPRKVPGSLPSITVRSPLVPRLFQVSAHLGISSIGDGAT